MGGEKMHIISLILARVGSPPRRRGKAIQRGKRFSIERITPAWAGKRWWRIRQNQRRWDHPRIGGEKFHSAAEIDEKMGSPPHRRGKVSTCCCASIGGRITPAWAGKRSTCCCASPAPTDHPRVGGEKLALFIFCQPRTGSPPRGRGIGWPELRRAPARWITPAWAGKSCIVNRLVIEKGDHPRVGGEKTLKC